MCDSSAPLRWLTRNLTGSLLTKNLRKLTISTLPIDPPLKMWYFPGFGKNQIQRLAEISIQQTVVFTIQFSIRRTVRFDFRGLNQRQILFWWSCLAARYTMPCNYHSARPDLLIRMHRWSQGTKNHALTNMCSLKRGGITWHYQVRISCRGKIKPVQIIFVNVVPERIFYGFNRSHSSKAYSKQSKWFTDDKT
jgi:hypothetical protein